MEFVKVESSQIAEVGFEEPSTLGIRFKSKSGITEYRYANVTAGIYQRLMAAPSIGSYFGQNIKSNPTAYPFTKVEADPPQPGGASVTKETNGTLPKKNSAQPSVDSDGDAANGTGSTDTPSPGSALALIDTMADDLLFTPGKVTDEQLATMRSDWLAEAKKYDISTESKRMALKRFARPLQKLRTGIEARAKELTGATKRKIAAIDAEKRRLVDIVGGIEDEVLGPLTAWEQEEEARKVRLANIIKNIEAKAEVYTYPDIPSIEAAIAELEAFDLSTMQEYKVSAESVIVAVLKRLKPELERRKVAETERVELEKLRADAAARAEQDRINAAAEKLAADKIQAAVEAAKVETRQEVIAELAAPVVEEPVDDLPVTTVKALPITGMVETREQTFNREAVAGLMGHCYLDRQEAIRVLTAITKGLIPHVEIHY
jgi:hypothetical protein